MMSSTARATVRDNDTVFAALGDPTRLAIIRRLCETGQLAAVKLAHGTVFTQSAWDAIAHLGIAKGSPCRRYETISK
jgi:hypothetical protein